MDGWSVRVTCPHGVLHEMPLGWLYSMKPPRDMCPLGKMEEMETAPSPSRFRLWREGRALRKELRKL